METVIKSIKKIKVSLKKIETQIKNQTALSIYNKDEDLKKELKIDSDKLEILKDQLLQIQKSFEKLKKKEKDKMKDFLKL